MMKVIDMHCDTISRIWYSRLRGQAISLRDDQGNLMISLDKMQRGNYLLQNFAIFTDLHLPENFNGQLPYDRNPTDGRRFMDPWDAATEMIRVFHEEMAANEDLIGEVRCFADLEKNRAAGKLSGMLTIEEGGILKGDVSKVETLYDLGARMMTLTWNYENELGFPNQPMRGFEKDFRKYYQFVPEEGNGLKGKGFEVLEEMQRLGIIPDVSHLSDAGFYDVARTVRGPFVASHSNARSTAGCNRNMTDEMIRIVAEHGGVIGLNFCPAFVTEAESEDQCVSSMEGLVRHAKHIMNVGGREVCGLGTDFDGIGHENLEVPNAGEMQKLCEYMERSGLSHEEVEGIFYKNVMRVYRDVLSFENGGEDQ